MRAFSKATSYAALPCHADDPSPHAHVDPSNITCTPGGFAVEFRRQTNTAHVRITRDGVFMDHVYHGASDNACSANGTKQQSTQQYMPRKQA